MKSVRPFIQQARAWYGSRPEQDQRALKILAIALIPTLLYFAAIFPLQRARAQLAKEVLAQEADLSTMQENVARVLASRTGGSGKLNRAGRRLKELVSDTAPEFSLIISRQQPRGETELQVWLEESSFEDSLRWLHQLETGYGLQIGSVNFSAGKTSGMVKLQVKLKDGT